MELMGGLLTAESREVPLSLSSADYGTGFNNVVEMKVWGDLDPAFKSELFGQIEGDSRWIPFKGLFSIVLSAGSGDKTISAKIRTATGVESDEMSKTVNLSVTTPEASILWSKNDVAPKIDTSVQFGWSASHAFTEAAVCVAPTLQSSYEECTPVLTYGAGAAGEHQWCELSISSLMASDLYPTQSGEKPLKVFVKVGGTWY